MRETRVIGKRRGEKTEEDGLTSWEESEEEEGEGEDGRISLFLFGRRRLRGRKKEGSTIGGTRIELRERKVSP